MGIILNGYPDIQTRVIDIASYIIMHHATVRMAAEEFHFSKSLIHRDMRVRLQQIDKQLYTQVDQIFNENWMMKHLRGGEATARMYAEKRIMSGT